MATPAAENDGIAFVVVDRMYTPHRRLLSSFGLAVMLLGSTGPSNAAAPADAGKAAERCEAAVAEAIREVRGKEAREVEFVGRRRVQPPGSGDEAEIKGEGRYRGSSGAAVSFGYSCAFNVKTGATSGVVFRETGGTRSDAAPDAAWQPDLTHVSPEACETAIAAALKDKYPRVENIVFSTDTRQLQPAANARLSLEGQGALQRAAGMNAQPFKYRCELEARSGKVVGVQTSE